jgi:hypothetical protein
MWSAEAPEKAAPDFRDRLQHDRGFRDAEARAAVGLRHGDAEPAGLGKRAVELQREAAVAILSSQ